MLPCTVYLAPTFAMVPRLAMITPAHLPASKACSFFSVNTDSYNANWAAARRSSPC